MSSSNQGRNCRFLLIPLNDRATEVVHHERNERFRSKQGKDGWGLEIGHVIAKDGLPILASLGKSDSCDIVLEGSGIANCQCSFRIEPENSLVMLHDDSANRSTRILISGEIGFDIERPRRIIVQGLQSVLKIGGGVQREPIEFELRWPQNQLATMKRLPIQTEKEMQHESSIEYGETGNLRPRTRMFTYRPGQKEIRYATAGHMLGRGSFGKVFKAVDIDTANVMAVKMLSLKDRTARELIQMKNEIEILARVTHPNIVTYIAAQGREYFYLDIFTSLAKGTLRSLILQREDKNVVARCALRDVLSALKYLHDSKNLIHRDVKPENILYIVQADGRIRFQLGDFGFTKTVTQARSLCGTDGFIAPEIIRRGIQTDKVDIWSLFITFVWALDPGEYDRTVNHCPGDVMKSFCSRLDVSNIVDMADEEPENRPSAASLLDRFHWNHGTGY